MGANHSENNVNREYMPIMPIFLQEDGKEYVNNLFPVICILNSSFPP